MLPIHQFGRVFFVPSLLLLINIFLEQSKRGKIPKREEGASEEVAGSDLLMVEKELQVA